LPTFDFDRGASYISIFSFEERAMNPKACGWLALLAALIWPGAAPADTHAIVTSTRVYQDQETSVTFDYWVGADKSCRRTPGRRIITRQDLGIVWTIDLNARTYTVSPIEKSAVTPSLPRKPDRRKLWLDSYQPDFAWTIRDTGETKSCNGFDCRLFEATGEADFSEITARYWIYLAPGAPGGPAFHDYSVSQYREDRRMAALVRILDEHPASFCVYREETVEPAIAPTVRTRTWLTKIEEAAAPPATYELPPGIKRREGRGEDR